MDGSEAVDGASLSYELDLLCVMMMTAFSSGLAFHI